MGRHTRLAGLLVLTLLLPVFAADDKDANKANDDKDTKKPAATEKDEPKKDAPKPDDPKGKDAPKPEEKKDAKKPEPPAKAEPKEKLIPLGTLVGKLTRVEGAEKFITVQVTQAYAVPSGNYRPSKGSRPSVQTKEMKQDIELQPADELIVRVMNLPPKFDDKGRPRKPTKDEIKELKGTNPKLPGYAADFESLKPDQLVQVSIAKKKDATVKTAPRPIAKAKTKEKKDDDAAADPEPERPLVTMIVILGEPVK